MIELNINSIINIFINPNSNGMLFIILLKRYIAVSYKVVAAATINIIVNLLSFEKSLLNISAKSPIVPNAMLEIPIELFATMSKYNPIIIPNINPNFFPKNNPIKSINITYRFGIIPAILNHVKKFDCKKYIIKKVNTIYIIACAFFNFLYLSFYFCVITKTVSNLSKLTAGSIIAYLFVRFLVFTTFFIVPIIIPFE